MNRILVFRGGALGDFVLTLPTLKALRDACPQATIHLVASKSIALLAEGRFYADEVRSIEDARLASFFVEGAELAEELRQYFGSFDIVISYLRDPEGVFAHNLQRAGVRRLLSCNSIMTGEKHAVLQLAHPLEPLGLTLYDAAPRLFPSKSDHREACAFLGSGGESFVALHPGSGSARKNWPVQRWLELGRIVLEKSTSRLLVIGGEADEPPIAVLRSHWNERTARFAINLPLPVLAALLKGRLFFGHDSGVSHLAAAAGARCVLLFGPTNPNVWAPLQAGTEIVVAPDGDLSRLTAEQVWSRAESSARLPGPTS